MPSMAGSVKRSYKTKVARSNTAPAMKRTLGIPTSPGGTLATTVVCLESRPHRRREVLVLFRFMMVIVVPVGVFQVRDAVAVVG